MPVRPVDHGIVSASGAGGAEITGGNSYDSQGDGYIYEEFTSSGTATVTGDLTVDLIVVGGGGGLSNSAQYNRNSFSGAGGGGGVLLATGLAVTAGDYTVTIGALGSNGASASQYRTNGGTSVVEIGGVRWTASGGGFGGWGGDYYAGNGNAGSAADTSNPNSLSGVQSSGGASGGSGLWSGYTGATAGSGASSYNTGGNGGATVTLHSGGNGAGTDWYGSPGGGGSGTGNAGSKPGGGAGETWNNFESSSDVYGSGGTATGTDSAGTGYGKGSSWSNGNGQAGVVIFRWAA